MAISFVAAGTVVTGANPTVTVPAGTAKNDLLIIVTTGQSTTSLPTGWVALTIQGSGTFGSIFYKYATATEASVALTNVSASNKAVMIAYRGAGAIQAIPAWTTGATATATPGTVTTTYANDFVVSVYLDALSNPARTWTASASTTSRVNSANTTALPGMLIADETQAAAGVSTARAATLSGSATWGAFAFALIPTRTVYWVLGSGSWVAAGAGLTGTMWADASNAAGGKIIPTQNDAVVIDASSGSPTVTLTAAVTQSAASLTTTGATCTITSTGTPTINGSMTLSATTTWSATGTISFIGTGTITTNGVALSAPITFNGDGQTFTLGTALTIGTTLTTTYTIGTLALGTFTLSCGLFVSTVANTRVIAFGTGNITTTGSGTAFNVVGTGLTYTGTPTVNISNNSATATTITATSFTEATAFDFNITTGTYALTVTTASVFKSLNFTGYTGTWAPASTTLTFYGSLTLVSGMTFTTGTGIFTFAATLGTQTITSAGKTLASIIQSGVGGTVALADALTLLSSLSGIYTLTNGTLNLANFTLSAGGFSSSNSNTRVIQFGTGAITCTFNTTLLFNVTATGLTYTGTPTVNLSNNSATAAALTATGFTEASAFNFNVTVGTYTLTVATASVVKSLNFTGFTGTWAPTTETATFYGSLTLVSGMTFTAGQGIWTFAATSGTQTITSAAKILGPLTQSGAGGTVTLGDALTLTNAATFGTYTYTAGTLNLNNFTLSAGGFSSISGTRVIQFGSGAITVTSSATAFNAVGTSLTYTGTPTVNISNNSATATTITATSFTEATAFNFNITTGTYALTVTTASVFDNLIFTGFTGTWAPATATATFYGSLTLVSGMTFTTGTGIFTFAATSGTQTIISAGKTLNPITQSGAGGTVALGSALTMSTTSTYTYTAGTLSLSTFTLSCGLFVSTSGTRVIAFGTGAITITGSGTAFNAVGTTLTYTGTPTVNISNNSAAALTLTATSFTEATAFNFNITTGTYALTVTTASFFKSLNFTGYTGTWAPATATATIYGSLTLVSGMTFTTGTGLFTFASTSATQVITSAGKTLGPITIPATVATFQLADALTMSTTATFTWGGGTLNLNSFTLTCGLFDASASGTRFYTWGATGAITCIGSGTVFNAVVGLGLFNTGTPTVNISTSSTATISAIGMGESQSFNFNVTTGTYALTLASGSVVRSLSFAGFTGSWSPGTNTTTFYGNLTLSSGMTTVGGSGAWTFAATSGTQTIASFGQTSNTITQNNPGATLQLVDGLLSASTYTYTAGTLNINSFSLSCLAFFSSSGTRVIQFGTGLINVYGLNTTPFNVDGTGLTYTGTPKVNINNFSTAATTVTIVAATGFTETNALSVYINAGSYQLNEGGSNIYRNLDFTGFSGDLISASTKTIYGNYTSSPSMSYSGAGGLTFSATSGTQIITSNGSIIGIPISQLNPGATLQLADNLTMSLTAGFAMGTTGIYILNLNNFELACSSFSSTGTNTRTFQFGTGAITVTGSGATAFSVNGTGLTYTGTPTVNINNNSATATTVTTSTGFTESNALNVNIIAGTYTLTETASNVYRNLNYIGFSGTASGATARTIYGSLTLSPTMTYSNSGTLTLAATSGTQVITSNGISIPAGITQSGAGGTVQLGDNLTMTTTATYTYTAGTALDLNSFTFSPGLFVSTSGTRVIAFGTGAITVTGSGTSFNVVGTSLTYTGTPTVNISNSTATATNLTASTGFTEANAFNFNINAGSYALSVGAEIRAASLNFTGYTGTWAPGTSAATLYGNLTLSSGMTFTAGTGVMTFAASSSTQTITSAGKTLGPITQNGAGGTIRLANALTMSTTATYTYTAGTALDLNNQTLSTGLFVSTSGTRVIAFGSGAITVTGSGSVFNMVGTGLTYSGTPTVNINNNSATATLVTVSTGFTETNALNFNYISGTYALTDTGAVYNNINWTGFTGTVPNSTRTIYGNWTTPTLGQGTYTAGANVQTFAATLDTQIITSNGQILDFPITVSGAGGTVGLADTLVLGSGRTLTVSAGTFNASENNVSAGSYSLTGGTIVMGRGGWSASGVGTVWSATGVTIVPGTSTIILSDTSTAAKTFAGGGKTYNNLNIGPTLVSGTGAATYTFTGNNTWNTISDTKTAAFTVTLPASGTTTVNNWLAAGATGAVLTLNSSTTGVSSTLALAGPGPVTVDYMSIRDSTVTPSTGTWYAGANSTNVNNNTGWIFASFVPAAIISNFNLNGVTITS